MQSKDEKTKKNHPSRRDFFRGGAQVAASTVLPATAAPTLPSLEPAAEPLKQLLIALSTLKSNASIINPQEYKSFLNDTGIDTLLIDTPNWRQEMLGEYQKAMEASQRYAKELIATMGEGLPYPFNTEDVLKDAVNENMLRPASLEHVIAKKVSAAQQDLDELMKMMPMVNAKAQKEATAFSHLLDAVRELHPEYDESLVMEDVIFIAKQNSKNWADACQTADSTRQVVHKFNAVEAEITNDYMEQVKKVQQQDNQRMLQVIEKTTGQKTKVTQGETYLTIPGYAIDATYATLRDIITLRGSAPLENDISFPPKEQLIVARHPEENSRLYSVPVNPHLPPNAYTVKLTKPLVERLVQIETGNAPFPRTETLNFEQQGAAAHYLTVGQRNIDLANDLEQLKSLLAGKWANTAKIASRSGSREL